MSNTVMFYTKDNPSYKKIDIASREIIKYCLEKKLGVLFNFLGYCDDLIAEINTNFYFIVSDDFIQLNSEFLTISNIMDIDSVSGKKQFCENFYFFDDIYNLLKSFKFKNIGLIVISNNSSSLESCKKKEIQSGRIVDCLYETIIKSKDEKHVYGFSNVSITFK